MDSDPVQWSGEWWQSRTPEQLNELLRGSIAGTGAFDGAVVELDRRAFLNRKRTDRAIAIIGTIAAVIAALASIAALLK